MRTLVVPSAGDPGTFEYDVDEPTYYSEKASYAVLKILYFLGYNGFVFQQAEASDLSALSSTWETYFDDIQAFLTASYDAYVEGDPLYPPSTAPDLGTLLSIVAPGSTLAILFRIILRIGLGKIYSALLKEVSPESFRGSPDGSDYSVVLQAIKTALSSLATTLQKGILDKNQERFLDRALLKLDETGEILGAWLDYLNSSGLTLNINGQNTTVEYNPPVV